MVRMVQVQVISTVGAALVVQVVAVVVVCR